MIKIINGIKKEIEERKNVRTFCMNKGCCIVTCKYNPRFAKNVQRFGFYENTRKCAKPF